MTSLPDDGECRPMSLRHDSVPLAGGLSERPPRASCPQTINQRHTQRIFFFSHHFGACHSNAKHGLFGVLYGSDSP